MISATLSVLCNTKKGYSIIFHAANACSPNESSLAMDSYQIPYTATMITNGIRNANIVRSSLNLQDPNEVSVEVNFNEGVLPQDGNTEANEIVLQLSLANQAGGSLRLLPMGTYTDIITATAALN